MTKTKYYDLQMDDPQDDYDVDVVHYCRFSIQVIVFPRKCNRL